VQVKKADGSYEPPRVISFKVRNNPQIKQFSSEILEAPVGYEIVLRYEVVNTDTVEVSGDKQAGEVLPCSEDPIMKGINVCKGEVKRKVKQIGENNYTLTAVRGSKNNGQNIKIQGLNLSPSIPSYGVVSNKNDEEPDEIQLPSSGSYRVKAIRLNEQLQEGPTDFEKEGKDGAIITLDKSRLEPRTDYKIRLEKLAKLQGNVLGTMEKIVTTGDQDLVLWVRFNEDPKDNITCDDADDPAETICDYSGNSNHGIPQGTFMTSSMDGLINGLVFNGQDTEVVIENSDSLNPESMTIGVKFKLGIIYSAYQEIADKRLGGGGYTFRLQPNPPDYDHLQLRLGVIGTVVGTVEGGGYSEPAINYDEYDIAFGDNIAAVCSYGAKDKIFKILQTNKNLKKEPVDNTTFMPQSNPGSLIIGNITSFHPGNPHFSGTLYDFLIFKHALTDQEFTELFP
ncbi:MAG: hypothetical protein HYU97_07880, partial [Deltaproteobacteria bacterium]|nr:hypothetical protein [Deltaproteobacteria bacterium]